MKKNIMDLLQSENGAVLEVEGLISDLSEGLTKNGKPFVNGQLFANGETAPFKVWDIGLELFKTEKKVGLGTPVLLHGAVNVNPQNGEKQLVIRDDQDCPALTLLEEGDVERLSQATQIPIDDMRRAILGNQVINHFLPEFQAGDEERPALCEMAVRAMAEVETGCDSPYSCEVHHYRGGFIEHIYNVVYKMLYPVGIPKGVQYDWGVMYTALLLYHAGWVRRTEINPVTGLVSAKDEMGPVELGSDGLCDYTFAVSVINEGDLSNIRVRNALHCVASLNGLCAPASVEAQLINSYVKEELRVAETLEATKGLPKYSKGMKVVNGKVKTFLNY